MQVAVAVGCLAASQWATANGAPSSVEVRTGREIYERCAACHSLERDRTGPRHCGLFGRLAGSVAGFPYCDATGASGIGWTRETLDVFLADPLATVPGTYMGYAGLSRADERARLLSYLEEVSDSERCREIDDGR